MRALPLILFLIMASLRLAFATTWQSDGTPQSIQSAHNFLANDGDTITLPAGTFTWTSGIGLTKGITLQGQGVGSTTIRDNIPTNSIIFWTLPNSAVRSRMTGIEFQNGGRTVNNNSIIRFNGSSTSGATLRVDHCKFNSLKGIIVPDTVIGVFDHNSFIVNHPQEKAIEVKGGYWNGATLTNYGHTSWAAPLNWGSSQFLFIEDNDFDTSATDTFGFNATDGEEGCRFVGRHNTLHNFYFGCHGTDSFVRSGRAMEIYNNAFRGTGMSKITSIRGGSILAHDNTLTGYSGAVAATMNLGSFRCIDTIAVWGGADGTNIWDVNDSHGVYFTGTVSGPSVCLGSDCTVPVSGAGFSGGQWNGYTVRRRTNSCNYGNEPFGFINGTTAPNVLRYRQGAFGVLRFCTGDQIEIRRVVQALDQPGRGGGGLITGDSQHPIPPAGWPNQVTEPCYEWNNTSGAQNINFINVFGTIRAGEHYFTDTQKPGYTPYVYPHPLVTGQTPSPTPTATPSATVTPTATATATPIGTPTSTPIASTTPTSTPTPTPTPDLTASPSASPTISPDPSSSPDPSPTPTPTATPQATPSSSPTPTATVEPSPTPTATPATLHLAAVAEQGTGSWRLVSLSWTGAVSPLIDIYSNGTLRLTAENDAWFQYSCGRDDGSARTWKVCEAGTQNCSNTVTK